MLTWYEQCIGKPWVAAPSPPKSFNCGELVRHIYKKEFGIEMAPIKANAASLQQSIANMRPELFDLRPLAGEEKPREFDVAFFARAKYEDHCGLAAMTVDGLLILHCLQNVGVILENETEAKSRGFRSIEWYRHKGLDH